MVTPTPSIDVLLKVLGKIPIKISRDVLRISEAVAKRCFVKKLFLKTSQNSQENTFARVSFLIELQASTYNFIKKETLTQVFSCEFCKISKNTFSYRTASVAASGIYILFT